MDRGIESGSGIVSSLQGMGSGRSRSLSPEKVAPYTLPKLYCRELVKPVFVFSESESAYQTLCKDFELVFSHEVLLSKRNYKN